MLVHPPLVTEVRLLLQILQGLRLRERERKEETGNDSHFATDLLSVNKIAVADCNSPSLYVSKGIGGTSSSQSVSAEPKLADSDGAGSWT